MNKNASKNDPLKEEMFVAMLQRIINMAVRALAVIMVFVIWWGVADVVWVLYQRLLEKPMFLLKINDILETFGAFMAVLIAIEIFVNIVVYLRDDFIHVKIVLATALMAIARKIIILDTDKLSPEYIYGLSAVMIAMSVSYWLVVIQAGKKEPPQAESADA
jgi:uncharacterized membrane protein (DUF373 family)